MNIHSLRPLWAFLVAARVRGVRPLFKAQAQPHRRLHWRLCASPSKPSLPELQVLAGYWGWLRYGRPSKRNRGRALPVIMIWRSGELKGLAWL